MFFELFDISLNFVLYTISLSEFDYRYNYLTLNKILTIFVCHMNINNQTLLHHTKLMIKLNQLKSFCTPIIIIMHKLKYRIIKTTQSPHSNKFLKKEGLRHTSAMSATVLGLILWCQSKAEVLALRVAMSN